MYQSPDVIKVKVNVEDVFASYTSACPHDEYQGYTVPCGPSDPNFFHDVYIEEPYPWQCYSLLNM